MSLEISRSNHSRRKISLGIYLLISRFPKKVWFPVGKSATKSLDHFVSFLSAFLTNPFASGLLHNWVVLQSLSRFLRQITLECDLLSAMAHILICYLFSLFIITNGASLQFRFIAFVHIVADFLWKSLLDKVILHCFSTLCLLCSVVWGLIEDKTIFGLHKRNRAVRVIS